MTSSCSVENDVATCSVEDVVNPRRMGVWAHRDTLPPRLVQRSKRQNIVEHEESVHNVYLDDGYYDSPETLVEAINLDKVSRVKCSYDSVT